MACINVKYRRSTSRDIYRRVIESWQRRGRQGCIYRRTPCCDGGGGWAKLRSHYNARLDHWNALSVNLPSIRRPFIMARLTARSSSLSLIASYIASSVFLVRCFITVARDRDSDSERLLYFGRVSFFYFFPSTKFSTSVVWKIQIVAHFPQNFHLTSILPLF